MSHHPENAFLELAARMAAPDTQSVPLAKAAGRILAKPLLADRDSPPFDCSAMDGFAVRAADLTPAGLPVCGESRMGHAPEALLAGAAMRISTGAAIPPGADAVIPVEHVNEQSGMITPTMDTLPQSGRHIRHRGENAVAGTVILNAGTLLGAAQIAAMAAFGETTPLLFSALRVAVIATGDELISPDQPLSPWCIRDSNLPGLSASVAMVPWLELVWTTRVPDHATAMMEALYQALTLADIVLTTGAVSKGHRDYMPQSIRSVGGEVAFHGLPVRPGGPVLGAVAGGKVIFALPGNPVSTLVLWRRFVLPALSARLMRGTFGRSGFPIRLMDPIDRPHPKWNYHPVQRVESAAAKLLRYAGSGDMTAAAAAEGFIEVPPNTVGHGPFSFFSWGFA